MQQKMRRRSAKSVLLYIHKSIYNYLQSGVYKNSNGHLPDDIGRVWYEADINYTKGYRGLGRIVFSNDGLVFVTYDHYETFYEII